MITRWLCRLLCLSVVPLALAVDLDREMILTAPAGRGPEDQEILCWQQKVARAETRPEYFERLGWAYVAKARRTQDAGFYQLAEKTASVMTRTFGPSSEALLLQGHVAHNLHRFSQAEDIARSLVAERGGPDDYALLSDALMEQGKLGGAIEALQHLASLKPGAEVDTRIAHVRWLKGDLTGAIRAMESAVRETSPQDNEALAWMETRLANYALQRGDLARAGGLADKALHRVPDYAPALLAAGRIRLADGDAAGAVQRLERATEINPLPEYRWCLAEACQAEGRLDRAATVEQALIATGAQTDPRTLAVYLATNGRAVDEAVRLAKAELGTRADVYTHDALAWALYARGDVQAAWAESLAALAEGTRDARLLLHAAMIARATGHAGEADTLVSACRLAALLPSERRWLTSERTAEAATTAGSQPVAGYQARCGEPLCSLNTQ